MLPIALAPNVVARLKVLAELMTYRTDIPQEGRVRGTPGDVEMRVSTFPTLYGEKAVIRLFGGVGRYQLLDDLGLPSEVRQTLGSLLGETTGAIMLAGPAGAGKTTSMYACLREHDRRLGGPPQPGDAGRPHRGRPARRGAVAGQPGRRIRPGRWACAP